MLLDADEHNALCSTFHTLRSSTDFARGTPDGCFEDLKADGFFDGRFAPSARSLFELLWASETMDDALARMRHHPEFQSWLLPTTGASSDGAPSARVPTGTPSAAAPTLSATPVIVVPCRVCIKILHYEEHSLRHFTDNAVDVALVVDTVRRRLRGPQFSHIEAVEFLPIEVRRGCDKRGPYCFDPLRGILQVAVVRDGGGKFQGSWEAELPGDTVVEQVDRIGQRETLPQGDHGDEGCTRWIQAVCGQERRPAERILQALKAHNIFTMRQLLNIPTERLTSMQDLPKGDLDFILAQRKLQLAPQPEQVQRGGYQDAEHRDIAVRARLHQVRRYFYFQCGRHLELDHLDEDTVKRGMERLQRTYKNEAVVRQLLTEFLSPFYAGMDKVPRGLLLYGPPGTGKTVLVRAVSELCGLFLVEPMMMGAELNKSYVGESEELIRQLFHRAREVPHLPCIVALDEIDSAVPKRDESGGGNQHGADKVSTMLGLIDGGDDVSNLALVGASNRREAIDTAIHRRMPVQIYVGFPDEASRRELLGLHLLREAPEHLRRHVSGRVDPAHFFEHILDLATELTMNFSGAAVRELCDRLMGQWARYYRRPDALVDEYQGWRFQTPETVAAVPLLKSGQYAALMACLASVSNSYNLKVGALTIPELLSTDRALATDEHRFRLWSGPHIPKATGLMIINPTEGLTFQVETYTQRGGPGPIPGLSSCPETVDFFLRPRCTRCGQYAVRICKIEADDAYHCHVGGERLADGEFHLLEDEEVQSSEEFSLLQTQRKEMFSEDCKTIVHGEVAISNDHILREAAAFAKRRGLTRVIYADMSTYLLSGAAANEGKLLEEFVVDVKQVLAPGSRALLVLDLDSLAGVHFSQSEGSMSSQSHSLGNRQLFEAAVGAFSSCRAGFVAGSEHVRPAEPRMGEGERWCLAIIRSPFLLSLFRDRTQWPLSRRERVRQRQEEEERREVRCARCGVFFRECDNKGLPGGCSYHPSAIFHYRSRSNEPEIIEQVVKLDRAMRLHRELSQSQADGRHERVHFGCCGKPPEPGGGCRPTRHCTKIQDLHPEPPRY